MRQVSMDKDIARTPKVWQKTPTPNLFKHLPSGNYYLRARVGGPNAKRESLKTDNYQVARIRLSAKLDELRQQAPPRKGEVPLTLWDALRVVEAQVQANPALKQRSKDVYADIIRTLHPSKPCGVPATPINKVTQEEIDQWWARTAAKYAPARANYQLLFLRRAFKVAIKSGVIRRDLGAELKIIPVPRTRLKLITKEQFATLVQCVRAFPAVGRSAADWVEFVTYTGTRPEEAFSVMWEHVDRAANVLRITGNQTGTKNRRDRHIPIMKPLADLLDCIAVRTGATQGRILSVRNPGATIKHACKALGMPILRRYDFRHLFATRCNESGVDVPTISKWLGHRDGGALVMKTYIHSSHAHEQQSAAKIEF